MTTLVKFLQQLQGREVKVELKNDTVVEGEVVAVEQNMNMHLSAVKVVCKGRDGVNYPQFTVKGTSIRHVKLPNTLPFDDMLEKCR